jgi:hypothetical protein
LRLEVVVELRLEAGDADLEELVEVRGADGQEPEPFEQGIRRVACLFEDALVEIEPAQLAVDEVAGFEGVRRGGGVATVAWPLGCESNMVGRASVILAPADGGSGRGGGWTFQEPEHAQVEGVELLARLRTLGRFQDHGDRAETRVVDDVSERFEAQMPAADPLVAIDPAPAFAAAVVQVPDSNPPRPTARSSSPIIPSYSSTVPNAYPAAKI